MSFATQGLPLFQPVINICASYLTPPESRYLALHQPADQDARALFAQFARSYNSQQMWDELAPSHGGTKGQNSRAVVTDSYEKLNARAIVQLQATDPSTLIPSDEDPFSLNARLQGLFLKHSLKNASLVGGYRIGGDHFISSFTSHDVPTVMMLIECSFSRSSELIRTNTFAINFYKTSFIEVQEENRENLNNYIYVLCLSNSFVPLFLKHGGKLNEYTFTATIQHYINRAREIQELVANYYLKIIKLHIKINALTTNIEMDLLLKSVVEKGDSNQGTCNLVSMLRITMIQRGHAFDDHKLLEMARQAGNEDLENMAKELIFYKPYEEEWKRIKMQFKAAYREKIQNERLAIANARPIELVMKENKPSSTCAII
jgi:hypothetical protein